MNILFTNVGRRTYIIEYALAEKINYKNLEIHVAENDKFSAAVNLDKRLKIHHTPLVLKNGNKYLKSLFKIVKKNKIHLIIPLADYDLEILSRNKKKFKNLGCKVLISSSNLIKTFYDKRLTYSFCTKNKIKTPKIYLNQKSLKLNKSKIVVKKDIFGSASSGYLKLKKNSNLIFKDKNSLIQEHINGIELHFDILNDFNGKFLSTCVKKKFLMRAGETDKAEIIYKKKYISLAKKISKISKHVGNLDCDVIKSKRGDLYFIDFNPRFGGGYPFTHISGYNFIKAILDLMLNKKPIFPKKPNLIKASKGINIHVSK